MATTKQTRIFLGQVNTDGSVMINVCQGVNADGELIEKAYENVHVKVDATPALKAAAAAFLEACKGAVDAETVVDVPAVPEVPEVPAVAAVMDGEKEVTPAVAAVPAVPAVPEKRKPRFAGAATL
jgi:uncharacterized membrane protein